MRSFKIKASDGYKLRVKPYVINKGQSGEYYGLKNAEDNQVLSQAPNNWKTKKGAIAWAKKKGYEVVESSTKKQFSVKASETSPIFELQSAEKKYNADFANGPFACAEVDGRGHIYRDLGDSYSYGEIVLDEIADTFEAAKGAVDEWNRQVEDGITLSTKPKFNAKSVKASKSDKKKFSIKASGGQFADDINAENSKRILQALHDALFDEFYDSDINGVNVSMDSGIRKITTKGAYKFAIYIFTSDYDKDTQLEVISDPKFGAKFLCRVSIAPFKYDEQFEIKQTGAKQTIINKINEITSRLSDGVTAACDGVKASVLKKRQQAVKASDLGNSRPLTKYTERQVLDAMNVLGYHPWGPIPSRGAIQFSNGLGVSSFKDWKAVEEELDHILENGVGRGYTAEEQEWIPDVLEDILVYGKRWDDKYRGAEYEVDASTKTVKASHSAKKRKAIKASDADGIADEWEDIKELSVAPYNYNGYDDGDLLEDVDQYFRRFDDIWLNADFVSYNSPDDWSVDASLSSDGVGSDFNYFLEDNFPDLYETLNTSYTTEPDDYHDSYSYDLLDILVPNDFSIQFYPSNRQFSAPQIDFDTEDRQLKAQLEEARSAYEADRIAAYKNLQNGLGDYLASGITASTNIECAKSLNLNARNNWDEWVLYGYDINGADVDTRVIDFQGNVRDAVGELFAWPEVDTVDLYKRGPADYDGEYFNTITQADYEAGNIEASTDITAGIDIGKKHDYSNSIYDLSGYIRMLSDEVQKLISDDISVTVTDEAITFTQNGEVVYIQPTEEIIPEPDDLESDAEELATAVGSVLYDKAMREDFDRAWDATYDEDYATRAVEFSTDTDDDLEPITGEDDYNEDFEDFGFGFDSNGEPVTESTVEELERIAEEILDKSNLCKEIDQYASIKQFNYYASVPYVQESFFITFTYTADYYELSERDMLYEDGFYTTTAPYEFNFNVYCKNGEVEYAECLGLSEKDVRMFSVDRLELFAERLVAPIASEIYNATTNI